MGRFEIIQIHNEPVCAENCPVLIKRYVITDDRLGDRLIARIKLENTGERAVKALKLLCCAESESCLLSFDNLSLLPGDSIELESQLSISRSDKGIEIKCLEISV